MGIFRTLGEKPWLTPSSDPDQPHPGPQSVAMPMMGLRFFLVFVGLMFMLVTSVYFMRMEFPDWRSLPEPFLLWINTGLLVLASITFQAARTAARDHNAEKLRRWLWLSGVLSIAFMIGQLTAWRELTALGYFADSNPANAFFYMITALHWVHLAGGMIAWARTTIRLRRGGQTPEQVALSVGMCAVYWHFLLLVWVLMFILLLST